jgi:hypothetical protein
MELKFGRFFTESAVVTGAMPAINHVIFGKFFQLFAGDLFVTGKASNK